MRTLLGSLLLLTAAACQQAPPTEAIPAPVTPPMIAAPAPFTYAMSVTDALTVVVRDGAQRPLDRVVVAVRERGEVGDDGTPTAGALLYTGLTGPDGRCEDRLDHALTLAQVEVTLHRPGYQGRYDEPARRQAYGERAPAAWFAATPAELSALTIELTSTEVE